MNITRIAIENNRTVIGLLILIVLAGLLTFNDMPRSDLPGYRVRYAKIITHYPGASPEKIEQLVSDPLEKALQQVSEIKDIYSENRRGLSVITMVVKDEVKDIPKVWTDIRHRVDNKKDELPQGISHIEVMDEYDDVYSIIIGIEASDGFSYKELEKMAVSIKEKLFKIPETAKVEIVGIQNERVFIDYDNASLAEIGLTKRILQQTISSSNIISTGGVVEVGREKVVLEPTGSFESLEDLKRLVIPSGSSDVLYLGDVATIYKGYEDPKRHIVRVNGKEGLAIAVAMKQGSNIIRFGKLLDEALEEYHELLPVGVELKRLVSYDIVVNDNINSFTKRLLISVLMILLFMISFLGIRIALVVSSLVPMTLFLSLVIMDLVGLGLNQVTIVALMLTLGMLVLHAIAMTEALQWRMQFGIPPVEACYRTTKELALPLFVASLTLSSAYLCFYLSDSILGELFNSLFLVVAITLFSSWLLSITVIPVIVSLYINVNVGPPVKKKAVERLRIRYRWSLSQVLHRPIKVWGVASLLVLMAVWFIYQLPLRFFPPPERNLLYAQYELPEGTKIDYTSDIMARVEAFIQDSLIVNKERARGVLRFSTFIGKGAPKFDIGYVQHEESSAFANMLIITSDEADNQFVIDKISRFCFEQLPQLTSQLTRIHIDGTVFPIEVEVSGDDLSTIFAISDEVKNKLDEAVGTKVVTDNWGLKTKKFVVDIDQSKAQIADLTNEDIATSLETVLTGSKTGEFMEENDAIPIILRSPQVEKNDFRSLESVNIYSPASGQKVPLKAVADIYSEWQYGVIFRKNLYPSVTISADLLNGYTPTQVNRQLLPWLLNKRKSWPKSVTVEISGGAKRNIEAIKPVLVKLWFSLAAVAVLLLYTFDSFRKAFVVLLSVPAGLIGVLAGLFLTNSPIGFFALLGTIAMGGIAINNSIVLMERIDAEALIKDQNLQKAIIKAGRQRLRPVLLTLISTVLAMLPLWWTSDNWRPMAVSVVFGVGFAALFTLYGLPVLYFQLFHKKHHLMRSH